MTRWLDDPKWTEGTGEELKQTFLATGFTNNELRDVCASAGLDTNLVSWNGTPHAIWLALMQQARGQTLEALIGVVGSRRPALRPRLEPVLHAQLEGAWYTATDRYSPRLLGRGTRRALLNRSALSDALRRVVEDDYLVLNIRGAPGSGRSHTAFLLDHVVQQPGCGATGIIRLSIDAEWPEGDYDGDVNAPEFARTLALKVPLPADFDVDRNTHPVRISRDLATQFVARYRETGDLRRWIFIDGLDRSRVLPEVQQFVGRLAYASATEQLGDTRLILTGYNGEFAPEVVDYVLVEEEIDRISREHVERFFVDIGNDVADPLDADEAKTLVDHVFERAGLDDLRQLEFAAVEVARERFGS